MKKKWDEIGDQALFPAADCSSSGPGCVVSGGFASRDSPLSLRIVRDGAGGQVSGDRRGDVDGVRGRHVRIQTQRPQGNLTCNFQDAPQDGAEGRAGRGLQPGAAHQRHLRLGKVPPGVWLQSDSFGNIDTGSEFHNLTTDVAAIIFSMLQLKVLTSRPGASKSVKKVKTNQFIPFSAFLTI